MNIFRIIGITLQISRDPPTDQRAKCSGPVAPAFNLHLAAENEVVACMAGRWGEVLGTADSAHRVVQESPLNHKRYTCWYTSPDI